MKTYLDCIPCLLRQSLEAARMVSDDPALHEQVLRDTLQWTQEMNLKQSPPALGQRIHRHLRWITGIDDPYLAAKERLNQLALELLPAFRAKVQADGDPLQSAARLAIAANIMDLGIVERQTEEEMIQTMEQALRAPFWGAMEEFRRAIAEAQSILYLADNAGEIVFDRLLVEQLPTQRVTVAVRGNPVINDATLHDAQTAGLDQIVEVIGNGSDAPGTILDDCSPEFRRRFAEAELIIAKGQGNYETLNGEAGNIFFLFKVKCPVVADQTQQSLGMQILAQNKVGVAA